MNRVISSESMYTSKSNMVLKADLFRVSIQLALARLASPLSSSALSKLDHLHCSKIRIRLGYVSSVASASLVACISMVATRYY